jgi:hypothetical protein
MVGTDDALEFLEERVVPTHETDERFLEDPLSGEWILHAVIRMGQDLLFYGFRKPSRVKNGIGFPSYGGFVQPGLSGIAESAHFTNGVLDSTDVRQPGKSPIPVFQPPASAHPSSFIEFLKNLKSPSLPEIQCGDVGLTQAIPGPRSYGVRLSTRSILLSYKIVMHLFE